MKQFRVIRLSSNLKLQQIVDMIDPLMDEKLPKGWAVCNADELHDCNNHKPCYQYDVIIEKVGKRKCRAASPTRK